MKVFPTSKRKRLTVLVHKKRGLKYRYTYITFFHVQPQRRVTQNDGTAQNYSRRMDGTQRQVSEKYCALRTFETSWYLLICMTYEEK